MCWITSTLAKKDMEKEKLYRDLVGLIAPSVIADNFKLVQIVEKPTSITLYFEEKEEKIPEELMGKEVVQDGYITKPLWIKNP
jgi:hypothetical protein